MKRFIILVMVVVSLCAAQSTANDAQRLIGTWGIGV
jgi:hypothetical protein